MKRLLALLITVALLGMLTGPASARGGRGGGMRGGGARAGGGMRSMPSRPSTTPSRPSGGYNLNRDITGPAGGSNLQPINRPEGGFNRPEGGANRPGNIGERPDGGLGNRPPGGNRPGRPAVPPVNPPLPAWGWNGGTIWYPAPGYWGGGFWGPWAYGFTTAYVYGEIVNEETSETEKSYEIQPDSPGANVLKNYGLTQTQCSSSSGLVVIHGPQNSLVCANPNSTVAAGDYDLDVTNLTIVSRGAG